MVEQREHVHAVDSQESHQRCNRVFPASPGPQLRPLAAEPLVSISVPRHDQGHLHAHRPARIIVYDVLDDLPDRLLPRRGRHGAERRRRWGRRHHGDRRGHGGRGHGRHCGCCCGRGENRRRGRQQCVGKGR
jgi:hypothetical protein